MYEFKQSATMIVRFIMQTLFSKCCVDLIVTLDKDFIFFILILKSAVHTDMVLLPGIHVPFPQNVVCIQ